MCDVHGAVMQLVVVESNGVVRCLYGAVRCLYGAVRCLYRAYTVFIRRVRSIRWWLNDQRASPTGAVPILLLRVIV